VHLPKAEEESAKRAQSEIMSLKAIFWFWYNAF